MKVRQLPGDSAIPKWTKYSHASFCFCLPCVAEIPQYRVTFGWRDFYLQGVLLLYFITRNNPSLQKIVAFGKAFDILLDVVRDEGCSEGGVVVEDCLLLLSNLLTYNVSNIKLFKEDGCVTKLCSWYTTDLSSSASWSEQRKINAVSMLGVIRCLVSPLLTPPIVRSCQDAINKCGLLAYVCNILMTPGVPLAVLVQVNMLAML